MAMKFIPHDPSAKGAKRKNKYALSSSLQPNPVLQALEPSGASAQPAAQTSAFTSSAVAGPSSSSAPPPQTQSASLYQLTSKFNFRSPWDQERNSSPGRFSLTQPATRPPPPLSRPRPPKQVVVPLVNKELNSTPLTPIVYQSLALILEDLNRLLYTPHEGQPFDFRAVCAIIADPAIDNAERVRLVAAQVTELTAISFNPYTLKIHDFPQGAASTVQTAALWMGTASVLPPNVACRRCEHLLTVSVTYCRGPLIRGEDISGFRGQRIIVALTHFAG
ncbi:hypothetical protein FB45DRAFT_933856, partial [Roridomyces roridus]